MFVDATTLPPARFSAVRWSFDRFGGHNRKMTQIYGHRGAPEFERENTIASFEAAVRAGVDGVELDVRRCADGALVVHHNPHLDDGRALADVLCDDLPSYVPLFDAALDACQGVPVNVEIKNSPGEPGFDEAATIASEVAETLARFGHPKRFIVSSFHRPTLAAAVHSYPGVRSALLVKRATGAIEAAREFDAVNPDRACVSHDFVRAAHLEGLAVYVWTVNDPDEIDAMIAWGVDGIFTDVPSLALRRRETPG